jgi:hypothetical protein
LIIATTSERKILTVTIASNVGHRPDDAQVERVGGGVFDGILQEGTGMPEFSGSRGINGV